MYIFTTLYTLIAAVAVGINLPNNKRDYVCEYFEESYDSPVLRYEESLDDKDPVSRNDDSDSAEEESSEPALRRAVEVATITTKERIVVSIIVDKSEISSEESKETLFKSDASEEEPNDSISNGDATEDNSINSISKDDTSDEESNDSISKMDVSEETTNPPDKGGIRLNSRLRPSRTYRDDPYDFGFDDDDGDDEDYEFTHSMQRIVVLLTGKVPGPHSKGPTSMRMIEIEIETEI